MATGTSQACPTSNTQVSQRLHESSPPSPRTNATTQPLISSTGTPSLSRRKSTPHRAPPPKSYSQPSPPQIKSVPSSMIKSEPTTMQTNARQASGQTCARDKETKVKTSFPATRQTVPFKRQGAAPLAPRPVSLLPLACLPTVGTGAGPTVLSPSGVSSVQGVTTTSAIGRSQEAKLELKRIRNRLSAAKSNQKRREHLEAQKKELACLKMRVEELRLKKLSIARENESLKKQLDADNRQSVSG